MRCLSIALAALACAGCTSEARAPEADAAAQPAGDGGLPVSGGEILTQRYDNARTGANLRETALTQANAGDLELLGSWPVDGEIYAQILIADGVDMQRQTFIAADAYGLSGFPFITLIGSDGNVLARWSGEMDKDDFLQKIEDNLA